MLANNVLVVSAKSAGNSACAHKILPLASVKKCSHERALVKLALIISISLILLFNSDEQHFAIF